MLWHRELHTRRINHTVGRHLVDIRQILTQMFGMSFTYFCVPFYLSRPALRRSLVLLPITKFKSSSSGFDINASTTFKSFALSFLLLVFFCSPFFFGSEVLRLLHDFSINLLWSTMDSVFMSGAPGAW